MRPAIPAILPRSRSPRKRIECDKVCCTGSHGQEMLSAASQAADRVGYFFTSSTKTAGLLPFFPSAPPWYRQTQSSGSRFRFRFSSSVMALTPSFFQQVLPSGVNNFGISRSARTDNAQDLSPCPAGLSTALMLPMRSFPAKWKK